MWVLCFGVKLGGFIVECGLCDFGFLCVGLLILLIVMGFELIFDFEWCMCCIDLYGWVVGC